MITLALDGSTYVGDVAVLDGTRVVAEESVAMKGADQERLMPAVASCLARASIVVGDVRRVVCGAGPGSFTSLRIAGSIAKGIALGIGCPLFAVPSMALIVGGSDLSPGRYLVAIDALRSEFYVGMYELAADDSIDEVAPPRIVPSNELSSVAAEYRARVVSPSPLDGCARAAPRARSVGRLESMLTARGPVHLDSWEPAYGRLAEAQVKWESAHGRALSAG